MKVPTAEKKSIKGCVLYRSYATLSISSFAASVPRLDQEFNPTGFLLLDQNKVMCQNGCVTKILPQGFPREKREDFMADGSEKIISSKFREISQVL